MSRDTPWSEIVWKLYGKDIQTFVGIGVLTFVPIFLGNIMKPDIAPLNDKELEIEIRRGVDIVSNATLANAEFEYRTENKIPLGFNPTAGEILKTKAVDILNNPTSIWMNPSKDVPS